MSGGGAKPGERRGGRQKGTPNKITAEAKAIIEEAAQQLGGVQRLVAWAQQPENESKFWTLIFPKLLPLQGTATAVVDQTMRVVWEGMPSRETIVTLNGP